MPMGNNTLYFCHLSQILSYRKVTYAKLVATLRPQKEEEHRVQVTVGGDKTRLSRIRRHRHRHFFYSQTADKQRHLYLSRVVSHTRH